MSDFLKAVSDAFSAATMGGRLKVESSRYDAQAFGNAFVVLAGANLRVRVIRDRDDVFADAASCVEPEDWYPLQRVIRAVGVSPPPPEGLLSPAETARLVECNFSALDAGLAPDAWNRTKAKLAQLGQEALARMTNRLKGHE